jgi:hypothetical protein
MGFLNNIFLKILVVNYLLVGTLIYCRIRIVRC